METNQLIPVVQFNNVDVVDSRIIADELGVQHKNLVETIRKYQQSIEKNFGQVAFETETVINSVGAVNQVLFAYLTEDQAIFIGSLSRNTEKVVAFKAKLVKSFQEARRALQAFAVSPLPIEDILIQQLQLTKSIRLEQERMKAELEEVKNTVIAIEESRNKATEELMIAKRSEEEIPEETIRVKIRRLINHYCEAKNADQQSVWRVVYDRLYYRYGISLRAIVKRRNESTLDVAERLGHLEKIWAICSKELV